jgi:uncharacterized protein YcaQ
MRSHNDMGKPRVFRLSIEQARRYQLWAVRLTGTSYPPGAEGIRTCFGDLGCLQLDPLPVLGRNHDLVIQARVDGIRPGETLALIHRERLGFEYWDKMLCAIPVDAFPMFRSFMQWGGDAWERKREEKLRSEHAGAIEAVAEAVTRRGPLSSRELKQLDVAQSEHRGWKSTRAANGALEVLWNRGRLSVSHRTNYRRYFDLTERVIPSEYLETTPPTEAFWTYILSKRVRAVGLLPRGGDAEAWAFLSHKRREGLPDAMAERGELEMVQVEGIAAPFFAPATIRQELPIAEEAQRATDGARFIAPLDPLLWARTALERLWGFRYAWEVYKPAEKREHGYYVLPILLGERFVARFDGRYVREEGTLRVLSYHEEPGGLPLDHPAIHAGFQRFLRYLGGERIALPTGEVWAAEPYENASPDSDVS